MFGIGIVAGIAIGVVGMLPVARILQRRAERRARHAERRARESERLAELGSMTGGLAHEIKNPLSTIGLNAQLLTEGVGDSDLPEDQRERLLRRLGALSREVDRLRGILTDFLRFAGRMKLDPQPHDLALLVEELADFFHPQCDQAGVVLRTQVDNGPIVVPVDVDLVKQAVLNLMINAMQAMTDARSGIPGVDARPAEAKGELLLRVEVDDHVARIHVADTGPGIEPERLQQIFHPYISHRSGGSGLGLPTARRIAEEHGGRLEAHSEVGLGSEFVLHLPKSAAGGER